MSPNPDEVHEPEIINPNEDRAEDEPHILEPPGGALAPVAATQAGILIQSRVALAAARPRDAARARQLILKECERPRFAENAKYKKPGGWGKNKKTGEWERTEYVDLNIRAIEAACRLWGNMDITLTVVEERPLERRYRVGVMDLQTNNGYSPEFVIAKTVERKKAKPGQHVYEVRENDEGDTVYIVRATEDQVQQKAAATASKYISTWARKLLPPDLLDEMRETIDKTRAASVKQDPDAATKRILDSMLRLSVGADGIAEYLGHPLDRSLSAEEIDDLRDVYGALEAGEVTWDVLLEAANLRRQTAKPEEILAKADTALEKAAKKRADKIAADKAKEPKPAEPAKPEPPKEPAPAERVVAEEKPRAKAARKAEEPKPAAPVAEAAPAAPAAPAAAPEPPPVSKPAPEAPAAPAPAATPAEAVSDEHQKLYMRVRELLKDLNTRDAARPYVKAALRDHNADEIGDLDTPVLAKLVKEIEFEIAPG